VYFCRNLHPDSMHGPWTVRRYSSVHVRALYSRRHSFHRNTRPLDRNMLHVLLSPATIAFLHLNPQCYRKAPTTNALSPIKASSTIPVLIAVTNMIYSAPLLLLNRCQNVPRFASLGRPVRSARAKQRPPQ
jgi:hypothetical protein